MEIFLLSLVIVILISLLVYRTSTFSAKEICPKSNTHPTTQLLTSGFKLGPVLVPDEENPLPRFKISSTINGVAYSTVIILNEELGHEEEER